MLYYRDCPKLTRGMFELFSTQPRACEDLVAALEASTFCISGFITLLMLAAWARQRRAFGRAVANEASIGAIE